MMAKLSRYVDGPSPLYIAYVSLEQAEKDQERQQKARNKFQLIR